MQGGEAPDDIDTYGVEMPDPDTYIFRRIPAVGLPHGLRVSIDTNDGEDYGGHFSESSRLSDLILELMPNLGHEGLDPTSLVPTPPSSGAVRRLINQGGVRLDDVPIRENISLGTLVDKILDAGGKGIVLRVGRRRYLRLQIDHS